METLEGRIEQIEIADEMRASYLDYAMSVIVGRALPDVRDGLKPVHRRVLFGMHDSGMQPNRPYRKCARIVGDVMGNFHPHGDASIYDALVRMAQDFSIRYPLVDGHGNFGSVDGDSAAAMRYTECRLARIATEMLRDIDAETVDWTPNYDESREEPTVLPVALPQPAGQRQLGHRRRHGHQHPAAQPARDHRGHRRPHRRPDAHQRRSHALHEGPRLPHRRASSWATPASARPTRPAAAGSSCGRGPTASRSSRARRPSSSPSSPIR